jgi:cell division protein FtsL
MNERLRTVLLIIVLVCAVVFIVWMQHVYDTNFTNML